MKVLSVAAALAASISYTAAFVVQPSLHHQPSRLLAEATPCDIPDTAAPADLTSRKGAGSILRSAVVTNADGDLVSLGSAMGDGTSVVIFLRHMG